MANPIFNNNAFQDPNSAWGKRGRAAAQPGAAAPQFGAANQATIAPQFGAPGQQQQFGYGSPAGQSQYGQQQYGQQAQQSQQWAAAQQQAQSAAFQANAEGMYAAPAAGAYETGRMTIEDTVWKTAALFGILIVGALAGWFWALGGTFNTEMAFYTGNVTMAPLLIGSLGAFVMSMVVIFTSKKKIRPALIFVYAALEGLAIGGISGFFEMIYPGLVIQAVLATAAVVAAVLVLFATGLVRASKKLTKMFFAAMIGYMIFSLVNLVLMWTGALDGFGLREGPLGLVIGVVVVLLASYSLVLDFDGIQQGVRNGAPRQMGWYAGFGLMVTIVWLYLEILRILAIFRD